LRFPGERPAQEIRRLLDGAARSGRVGDRVQGWALSAIIKPPSEARWR